MLKFRFVCTPQCVTERKRNPEGTGRFDLLCMFADKTDRCGRHAVSFQTAGKHTAGVRAERSCGRDQDCMHTLIPQALSKRWARFGFDAGRFTDSTHDGVMVRRDGSDLTTFGEFTYPVDRKR